MTRECRGCEIVCIKYGIIQDMGRGAVDIYSFASLRGSGFTYVDKAGASFVIASVEEPVEVVKAIFRRDARHKETI